MGIIDKSEYTLDCPSCGASEQLKVVQHGSSYGASWSRPDSCNHFDVDWNNNSYGEPVPRSSKCKNCGHLGSISSSN